MTSVPIAFRKSPDTSVNFPYSDISSGLGFQPFYAVVEADDTGTKSSNLLSTAEYSSKIETTQTGAGTTTYNFDTSAFNLQKTAKGTAFCTIGFLSTNPSDTRLKVQIMKILSDGTTTVNISSEITNEISSNLSGVAWIKLPLTETNIEKDEKLRLVVKIDSSSGNLSIGHDPKNRDGTILVPSMDAKLTTELKLQMPFAIYL